jgi:hypothetical protein
VKISGLINSEFLSYFRKRSYKNDKTPHEHEAWTTPYTVTFVYYELNMAFLPINKTRLQYEHENETYSPLYTYTDICYVLLSFGELKLKATKSMSTTAGKLVRNYAK